MAYHVYHTEALLLGGTPSGEGDRLLYCYTRELGLVLVHAKSLREVRSRLRFALQTFSHAHLDLIHGKHGWKLISARPIDTHAALWKKTEKRAILAQYTELIRRLIQGEEMQTELFDEVLEGLKHLSQVTSDDELRATELVFVVRLLERLGYWGEVKGLESMFSEDVWQNNKATMLAHTSRMTLLTQVNRALRETQL